MEKPSGKDKSFVFFILKEKKLKVELKLIRNLIKKENENIFVILLFACFCYFWILTKLKLKLTELKSKA